MTPSRVEETQVDEHIILIPNAPNLMVIDKSASNLDINENLTILDKEVDYLEKMDIKLFSFFLNGLKNPY